MISVSKKMIVIGLNIKKSINFDLNFIRNFSVNNLTSSLITTGETGRIPSTTHQFHNYYLLKQSLIVYFIKYIILIYAVANSASSPCPFKASLESVSPLRAICHFSHIHEISEKYLSF